MKVFMNGIPFWKQAEEHQLLWRQKENILIDQNGTQNGITKEYILPNEEWLQGVWQEIRDQLERYIEANEIQANTGKHNLKSSWTQCANIFIPFKYNPHMKSMLVSFLKRELNFNISSINSVELEYEAPGKSAPGPLLGERGGMRGSGQTSPDTAILFTCADGKCGIYLIENKYTEHHFYRCSAARKTITKAHSLQGLCPNPNPERCYNMQSLVNNTNTNCHQSVWGRRYWEILEYHMNKSALSDLPYCPAKNDGYQLLRQQALAQGIADIGLFDYVISGVAYDERNVGLIACLSNLGLADFRRDWPNLYNVNSKVIFHCFSHQNLFSWVTRSRSSYIKSWGKYINERYGYK